MTSHLKKKSMELAATSVFSALAIGGGYALTIIPNVEVISFFVFVSGFIFGEKVGLLVGLISMTIYTTWNPWGAPIPVISLAQIVCMTLFGIAGGIYKSHLGEKLNFSMVDLIEIGFIAGLLTLIYDATTSIAYAYAFGLERVLLLVFATGAPYIIIHVVSNIVIFMVGIKPINNAVARFMVDIVDRGVPVNEERN
ncbi:MAG: hypothetical protein ACP6IS_02390 [Candidatus Asgardarchaeia archaeon]